MSVAVPQSVLDQINFDVNVARQNNPDRNILQKFVDSINKNIGQNSPNPSQRTSLQQVEYDRLQNKRLSKAQPKGGKISPKGINFPGNKVLSGLGRVYGGVQLLNPNSSIPDRMLGGVTLANPLLGTVMSSAAALGQYAKDNLPESDFTSGRGSGAQALVSKKQREKDRSAQYAAFGVDKQQPYKSRREGLENVYPDRSTTSYKPRRKALEELYPERYKDTNNRVVNGIEQKGTDFDTMSDSIFKSMVERNQRAGASDETLSVMQGMRSKDYDPTQKFSSIDLQGGDATDSSENPMPVEYTNYMASSDSALGSLDALRMNERQKGLIYASGKYYGEGADGKAVVVDRDLARKVKRGAEGADELLANFLGRGGLAAAADSVVEPGTNYKATDYNSQGHLLNDRNLLTFKDGSTRFLSDIPEDEDLSATY